MVEDKYHCIIYAQILHISARMWVNDLIMNVWTRISKLKCFGGCRKYVRRYSTPFVPDFVMTRRDEQKQHMTRSCQVRPCKPQWGDYRRWSLAARQDMTFWTLQKINIDCWICIWVKDFFFMKSKSIIWNKLKTLYDFLNSCADVALEILKHKRVELKHV